MAVSNFLPRRFKVFFPFFFLFRFGPGPTGIPRLLQHPVRLFLTSFPLAATYPPACFQSIFFPLSPSLSFASAQPYLLDLLPFLAFSKLIPAVALYLLGPDCLAFPRPGFLLELSMRHFNRFSSLLIASLICFPSALPLCSVGLFFFVLFLFRPDMRLLVRLFFLVPIPAFMFVSTMGSPPSARSSFF